MLSAETENLTDGTRKEFDGSNIIIRHDLPVRMDWSTLRVVDLIEQIRMSAGTLSPTITKQIHN